MGGGGGGIIPSFNLREVNESETLNFIKKLGKSTAFGLDGLDAMSMKVATKGLVGHITHLINI